MLKRFFNSFFKLVNHRSVPQKTIFLTRSFNMFSMVFWCRCVNPAPQPTSKSLLKSNVLNCPIVPCPHSGIEEVLLSSLNSLKSTLGLIYQMFSLDTPLAENRQNCFQGGKLHLSVHIPFARRPWLVYNPVTKGVNMDFSQQLMDTFLVGVHSDELAVEPQSVWPANILINLTS